MASTSNRKSKSAMTRKRRLGYRIIKAVSRAFDAPVAIDLYSRLAKGTKS